MLFFEDIVRHKEKSTDLLAALKRKKKKKHLPCNR